MRMVLLSHRLWHLQQIVAAYLVRLDMMVVPMVIILQQIVVACLVRQHQVDLDIILREACLQEKLCALTLQPTVRFFARRCLVQILT